MSTDGRMNKQNGAPTSNRNYSALKRKEILTNATIWMKLEGLMLSLC